MSQESICNIRLILMNLNMKHLDQFLEPPQSLLSYDTTIAVNKGSDNSLTLSNFDEIVNVRENLTSVDHQLSDIADIIKGYLSYRTTDRLRLMIK